MSQSVFASSSTVSGGNGSEIVVVVPINQGEQGPPGPPGPGLAGPPGPQGPEFQFGAYPPRFVFASPTNEAGIPNGRPLVLTDFPFTSPVSGSGFRSLSLLDIGAGVQQSGNALSVIYGKTANTALQGSLLGAASGAAPLGADSLVPIANLPAATAIAGPQAQSTVLAGPASGAGPTSWRGLAYDDIGGLGTAAKLVAGGANGALVLSALNTITGIPISGSTGGFTTVAVTTTSSFAGTMTTAAVNASGTVSSNNNVGFSAHATAGTVGFDTSLAVLSGGAYRMAHGHFISFEPTGVLNLGLASGSNTWQFLNGATAVLSIGQVGSLTAAGAISGPALSIAGNAAAATFGGDTSATTVLATGTTTLRAMSARAADVVNVSDYGALLNGSANDSAAFQAAYVKANGSSVQGGVVHIPAGRFNAPTFAPVLGNSVLWRADGFLLSSGGTFVSSIGDGDVLETFLPGRKHFGKTVTNNTDLTFGVLEVTYTQNTSVSGSGGVASPLRITATNNSTSAGAPGCWAVNATVVSSGASPDNYAIAGTAVTASGATGPAHALYLQKFCVGGDIGNDGLGEIDIFCNTSDPITGQNPSKTGRHICSFNVGNQLFSTGAAGPDGQVGRGITIGSSGGSIGAAFYVTAPIYYAAFDCSQAVFADATVAALRLAPNQPIDFSTVTGTNSSVNDRTLKFNSTSGNLEYSKTGVSVLSVTDAGLLTVDKLLVGGATGAGIGVAVTGTHTVGFDTSAATLTGAAFRMAEGQTLAFNAVAGFTIGGNIAGTAIVLTGALQLSSSITQNSTFATAALGVLTATSINATPIGGTTPASITGLNIFAVPTSGVAFSALGTTGAVGFDTAGATLTGAAFRMAEGQVLAFNSGASFTMGGNTGGTAVVLTAPIFQLSAAIAQNSPAATATFGVLTAASINSTPIGAAVASTGAFTTLSASGTVSGTGFSTYLASPPAIGGTAPGAITGLNVVARPVSGIGFSVSGTGGSVGFDTSGATLSAAAFRMGETQFLSFNASSTMTLGGNAGGTAVVFSGGIFQVNGALQIGSAFTSGAIVPTGFINITDSSGVVRKVACL